jgi:hypothetical protein
MKNVFRFTAAAATVLTLANCGKAGFGKSEANSLGQDKQQADPNREAVNSNGTLICRAEGRGRFYWKAALKISMSQGLIVEGDFSQENSSPIKFSGGRLETAPLADAFSARAVNRDQKAAFELYGQNKKYKLLITLGEQIALAQNGGVSGAVSNRIEAVADCESADDIANTGAQIPSPATNQGNPPPVPSVSGDQMLVCTAYAANSNANDPAIDWKAQVKLLIDKSGAVAKSDGEFSVGRLGTYISLESSSVTSLTDSNKGVIVYEGMNRYGDGLFEIVRNLNEMRMKVSKVQNGQEVVTWEGPAECHSESAARTVPDETKAPATRFPACNYSLYSHAIPQGNECHPTDAYAVLRPGISPRSNQVDSGVRFEFAMYNVSNVTHSTAFRTIAAQNVFVGNNLPDNSVDLVLSSYEPVEWNVIGNVRAVRSVHVSGYHCAQVRGVPQSIVELSTFEQGDFLNPQLPLARRLGATTNVYEGSCLQNQTFRAE